MSTVEADLDDFFRKRDKKKSKSSKTTKFSKIDTAELASHLEAVNSINVLNEDEVSQQQQTLQQQVDADHSSSVVTANILTKSTSGNDLINAVAPTVVVPSTTIVQVKTKLNELNLNNNVNDNGDEEWKPFESDENKNYTGLKIGLLQEWQNESDEENNTELNNELEKKPNCPWMSSKSKFQPAVNIDSNLSDLVIDDKKNGDSVDNKEANNTEASASATDDVATAKKSNDISTMISTAPTTGSYVPPQLRNQQAADKLSSSIQSSSGGGAYIPPHLRNKGSEAAPKLSNDSGFQTSSKRSNKNQPNINDAFEFPSLSDVVKPSSTAQNDKFEQPKRSAKVDTHNTKNAIDLENKYDALSS